MTLRLCTLQHRIHLTAFPAMLSDLHEYRIDALTPRTQLKREAKPDRNDPCPCGSGKKYKKCCGA